MKYKNNFYFYDLETTGLSPSRGQIMQFAGQRTDIDLTPIGEPDNIYIKINPDILPNPEAVLVTGITPQKTLADGISEADFLQYFYDNIALPGTIFTGFNTIRFDDEFMRFLNYRNFYDAYKWQWSEGRGKWDMLDIVRITRALRPEGINWPVDRDGKPVNKLELLTKLNNLDHQNAHDALSDVNATIAIAKMIKKHQPKLFKYLFEIRSKKEVEKLILAGKPFVYCSGRYPSEYQKTTIVVIVGEHPNQAGSYIVYDLRHDPTSVLNMTVNEIAKWYFNRYDKTESPIPFKLLQTNKCPAIAPLGVLSVDDQKRLSIDMSSIKLNYDKLAKSTDIADKLAEIFNQDAKSKQSKYSSEKTDVDSQLYEGFFDSSDKSKMQIVRGLSSEDLADLNFDFADSRLTKILLRYKARQYPTSLTEEEKIEWDKHVKTKLGQPGGELEVYFKQLNELLNKYSTDSKKMYLLEELRLYGESLVPYNY